MGAGSGGDGGAVVDGIVGQEATVSAEQAGVAGADIGEQSGNFALETVKSIGAGVALAGPASREPSSPTG
jgi:hypothetical protein